MDNTITNNLTQWDKRHTWPKDGDEWRGQAKLCGVSYETWKRSLIETFILPNASGKTVLEVAPGHGRWSEHIIDAADRTLLVDLSPRCIEYCRDRFKEHYNVEYYTTDGTSLPAHVTNKIDFVWSYDSFVHMDIDVIKKYFREFARVLRPDGIAIIHHGNRRFVRLGFLRRWEPRGRHFYRCLSQGLSDDHDGWRSNVSASNVVRIAKEAGLLVEKQLQYWGNGQCGVPRFNDRITIVRQLRIE